MSLVYCLILAITFLANLWTVYILSAPAEEPLNLASQALGGFLVCLVLPAIFWLIVRLILRNRGRPSFLACISIGGAGIAWLALGAMYSQHQTQEPNSPLAFSYHPEHCAFRVALPDEPRRNNIIADSVGEYIQAEIVKRNYFIRVECVPISLNAPSEQSLRMMQAYSKADGLSNATYQKVQSAKYSLWEMRAYKRIETIPYIFKARTYFVANSLLVITVAVPSEKYPNPIERRVFRSIEAIDL